MSALTRDEDPYPEDGWLRGYFKEERADQADSAPPHSFVKNTDFLRLRDFALGLLGPLEGRKVLDVGCAGGAMMALCGLQGAEVYGQDISAGAVEIANRALARFRLRGRAVCGDARELLFPDNHFDACVSADFFEHVTDGEKVTVLREMLRVLKPGGTAVIKTPNLSYLRLSLRYKQLRSLARARSPRRLRIPHTPGTDDPQHVGLTNRWGLTRCLLGAGFVNYKFHYAPSDGSAPHSWSRRCPPRFPSCAIYCARTCSARRRGPSPSRTSPTRG